jgi:hypothetical protein
MSEYPRLREMGINHPEHIKRYSVSSLNQIDYLLISYDRPDGSLLPISRTYEFPRVARQSASSKEPLLSTSPDFKQAIAELKKVMELRASVKVTGEAIMHEIQRLEEEVGLHLEAIRGLVKTITP